MIDRLKLLVLILLNEDVETAETGAAELPDYQSLDPNHLKLDRLIGGIFATIVSLIVVIGLVVVRWFLVRSASDSRSQLCWQCLPSCYWFGPD